MYVLQPDQVTGKMKVPSICYSTRASSLLPAFVFFLTCYVHNMESAKFTVIGPRDPVTAVVGQEAVLPCHLSPRISAANMEVRWSHSVFASPVHLYRDGMDRYEGQMLEYQGRTELLKAGLTDGNIHLRILSIRPSDEGQYLCFVQDNKDYEEAVLELRVAALGSAPLLSVEGHEDGGIRVVCRSASWYPEPEVLWRDLSGQRLPPLSETKSQGDNGLFETETALIAREHANQNVSCRIRNTHLHQEKESAVYIADSFFPRVNSWMVALSVILVVWFCSIGLTVYLFKMKGKLTGEVERHLSTIGKLTGEVGKLTGEVGKLTGEAEKHLSTIENQAAELSWRRSIFPTEEANVTLEADMAHPWLILSEDGKRVRWRCTQQPLPNTPERFDNWFCVLGRKGFISGRHYWEVEVEVGDGQYWAVGVARESVRRKGLSTPNPKDGIWAVRRWGDEFWALTDPHTPLSLSPPSRIRVCLDCDGRQVTFIDAGTEASIFTFPPGSLPGERIRPWLGMRWDTDTEFRLAP